MSDLQKKAKQDTTSTICAGHINCTTAATEKIMAVILQHPFENGTPSTQREYEILLGADLFFFHVLSYENKYKTASILHDITLKSF